MGFSLLCLFIISPSKLGRLSLSQKSKSVYEEKDNKKEITSDRPIIQQKSTNRPDAFRYASDLNMLIQPINKWNTGDIH